MKGPKIKVIGIGGAGCNTISRLSSIGFKGIDLIAVNTDVQSLRVCSATQKILIGEKIAGGFGAGMDYKLGEKAIEESKEKIKEVLKDAEIVFLTAGLGGGSGTPAISAIGAMAKNLKVLSLAVVTLPFSFEGILRQRIANLGLKNLQKNVDAYSCIPNNRVLRVINKATSVEDAFLKIDSVLSNSLQGIFNLLSCPGIISIDFADLEEILRNSGRILFGVGVAKGENRAVAAASKALQSPLLDFSIKKSQGILFNVGGSDVSLFEVSSVANFIKKITDKRTKIIFGVSENEVVAEGEIKVTLIATGIE